ncbi:hypothetical protein A2U01_0115253, partial [Trifolium medium]|nr:hypothetical protein [Trifolium medium]
ATATTKQTKIKPLARNSELPRSARNTSLSDASPESRLRLDILPSPRPNRCGEFGIGGICTLPSP